MLYTIVAKFGKPDLFITFTANPKWREITENIFPGQTSRQRFDIISRVFQLKKEQLIKDISSGKLFGKIKGKVHVVEFQKRGLPHCHILIILDDEFKLKSVEDINKCVSAEIPDSKKYPNLFKAVCEFMIHRPCLNKENAVCYKNNKCRAHFPKEYSDKTLINDDGYPSYLRRKNGEKIIVDNQLIEELLINHKQELIFIDSPGGHGKTYLLNCLITGMLIKKYKVLSVASTGIASTLLKNGNTVHSTFKIPLEIDETTVCQISKDTKLANFLKDIDLIIWDEITMSSKYVIEAVDRSLRDLCNSNKLFAGKILIFSGDFRQILPMVKYGGRLESIEQTIKSSFIWKDIKFFKLTKNLRINNDKNAKAFSNYLLDIGNGTIKYINDYDEIEIPDNFIFKGVNVNDFIDDIFKGNFNEDNILKFSDKIILAPLNIEVNELNSLILEKFKSNNTEKIYYSTNKLVDESDCLNLDNSTLGNLIDNSLPPHELKLKTGCIIMVIRNLNKSEGICNGTRGIVTKLGEKVINIKILTGKSKNKEIAIPRIILYVNQKFPIKFTRTQFPIKLSFAITINKAQGQSFNHVGLYLKSDCFNHGQLYVAMTRVFLSDNLKFFFDDENKKSTKNIVFKEIL